MVLFLDYCPHSSTAPLLPRLRLDGIARMIGGAILGCLPGREDHARVRYRKVTTWARLQTAAMPKVPSPMPSVMSFSTAQATAVV